MGFIFKDFSISLNTSGTLKMMVRMIWQDCQETNEKAKNEDYFYFITSERTPIDAA